MFGLSGIHTELAAGYSVEADRLTEEAWCELLEKFDDANIYQTWTYDEVRAGRSNLSHLVLKRGGEVVAAAQARIIKVPLLKAGIAYVRWGPMCRRKGIEADLDVLRQMLRALRNEYACRRGLVLRVYPILFREAATGFAAMLEDEGFRVRDKERPDRTLILDITHPMDELRKGLRPHWLRYLKVAEKGALEIIEGTDAELFEPFIGIYEEMVGRKRFAEPNDIREFQRVQRRLPERFKMKIMLCKAEGQICYGLISSAIGDTGIYLFGATSNVGLKSRGSYLLHWKLIEWLKDRGCKNYDLHGIDPVTNPGTYKFKADLCGENGRDVYFMGRFDCCTNILSHAFVNWGDSVRAMYRKWKTRQTERSTEPSANGSALAAPAGE